MVKQEQIPLKDAHIGHSFAWSNSSDFTNAILMAERVYTAGQILCALPEHLLLDRQLAPDHPVLKESWTCATDEYIGTTPEGKKALVVAHNLSAFTTNMLDSLRAQNKIKEGTYSFEQTRFESILRGTLFDSRGNINSRPLYSFDEFTKRKLDSVRIICGVVLDFDTILQTQNGKQDIQYLRENPLFIARAGHPEIAHAWVDFLVQRGVSQYGNWHNLSKVNPAEPQGRKLVMDYQRGFYPDYSRSERKLLVAPFELIYGSGKTPLLSSVAAQAPITPPAPSLDALVRIEVPSSVAAGLKSGNTFVYEGRRFYSEK